ncbi:MAG: flagellar biosynthesis protein FlhA, partial [Negativicutes bacterium]|nr:flagellar biosynthesis protein FlhA [Negativicutes bacterium]
ALQTYTLLTVGEGLVNQIPALLISTATGIIVTRAASKESLGADLISQILVGHKIFFIAAGVLLVMAVIPGLPGLPFGVLAVAAFALGWIIRRSTRVDVEMVSALQEEKEKEEVRKPENIIGLLSIDPMELEIGYSLIPIVDAAQGGDLLERIVMIRRQCATEMGIVVPTIRIRDNIQLKPSSYVIKLRGIEVASGELLIDHFLAMNPGSAVDDIAGIETVEPAFGLPAIWIQESDQERAEMLGYTVVDPVSVLATHLTEIIKSHAAEILTRQETQALVDNVKKTQPVVVEELVPAMLSLGDVQKVLAGLLRERVSIRDMVTILETLADHASLTKDTEILTEYVRHALARQITKQYVINNVLYCITVDPDLETTIVQSVQKSESGSFVVLEPEQMQSFVASLNSELPKLARLGYQPIVLTNPSARPYFRRLTERMAANLVVLSYAEIDSGVEIQAMGMVRI